jgi:hypothetical protein
MTALRRFVAVLCGLLAASITTAPAMADPCTEGDALSLFRQLKAAPTTARLVSQSPMLAAEARNTLNFDSPAISGEHYRVLVERQPPNNEEHLHLTDTVIAEPIDPKTDLVKNLKIGPKSSALGFYLPRETSTTWQNHRIFVIRCAGGKADIASTDVRISPRTCSIWLVAIATIILYLLAVAAARLIFQKPQSYWRCLDPVVLTAGPNGKGSISKLQIVFFSFIVFFMLAYIYTRTGVLSNLSTTILILLGVSAAGAAGSKAADVARNRLAFANWIWMIRKHWLPPGGLATVNQAKWRDLIASDGELDVYHLQMLMFSLVVGISLLAIGLSDLASFDIPENLLGLLGISQVVYLGGKLVTPPSCAELDKAVTDLRNLEQQFKEKAAAVQKGQPPSLAAAILLAPNEYAAFKHAVGPTQDMADEVLNFDPLPGAPQPELEPEYA